MVPRKKRTRYRETAEGLARKLGIPFDPDDWEKIWALIDEHGLSEKPVFLYAISDKNRSVVKFGRSYRPVNRMAELKTGNAGELHMWGFCPHVSPLTEKEVHKRLAEHRVSGEWFRMCDDVAKVVGEIQAAPGRYRMPN